jgi:hypothetical protein
MGSEPNFFSNVYNRSGLFAWELYWGNWDTPPTWYFALTLALIAVDLASACYIISRWMRVLRGKRPQWGLVGAAALLAGVLWVSHQGVAIVYRNIPQWDFSDGLFGDLTRPGPGRISADCIAAPTSPPGNIESGVVEAARPIGYDEALEIARIKDWLVRKAEFQDRAVVGWKGWIQDVSAHYGGDNPDRRLVALFLHDPYGQGPSGSEWPEVQLYYFTPEDARRLSVGQEVLLCGRVSDAGVEGDGGNVTISEPTLNPLPLPNAIVGTRVPRDFLLKYEVYGCAESYVCPEYKVAIDAGGRLKYEPLRYVQELEPKTAQLSEFKLRELVYELRRADFFSIENLPAKIEGQPAGFVVIEVRMDGRHKTIVLPWNTSYTAKVLVIEGKIKEVGNFTQWIGR